MRSKKKKSGLRSQKRRYFSIIPQFVFAPMCLTSEPLCPQRAGKACLGGRDVGSVTNWWRLADNDR